MVWLATYVACHNMYSIVIICMALLLERLYIYTYIDHLLNCICHQTLPIAQLLAKRCVDNGWSSGTGAGFHSLCFIMRSVILVKKHTTLKFQSSQG